ncbi:50S ribosomal protein L13 [Candidatus Uhrbacteria bacterium]|jgi:large subunit ribosomal protein L13|nr:50S ribosomal protein L13 [Candidatus Uhrbacteria bacterium]
MKSIQRDIHTIDATGKAPGRIATEAVHLLIGKHKPTFTPNIDGGDNVQVLNASKMVITGKKIEQSTYYRHSGYAGGLKETPLKKVWETDPADIVRRAVSRMLPKNKQRTERMKRLAVSN